MAARRLIHSSSCGHDSLFPASCLRLYHSQRRRRLRPHGAVLGHFPPKPCPQKPVGSVMGFVNAIGNLGAYFAPLIVGHAQQNDRQFCLGFAYLVQLRCWRAAFCFLLKAGAANTAGASYCRGCRIASTEAGTSRSREQQRPSYADERQKRQRPGPEKTNHLGQQSQRQRKQYAAAETQPPSPMSNDSIPPNSAPSRSTRM